MNNTVFSLLKRFAAFVTLVIAVSMTACTVVSPPTQQQGRGQIPPQQGYYPQQPYPGYGHAPQMTPQQWQQLQYLQQLASVQQPVPGGNAGQPQSPHGRLNVIPGAGRTFDARLVGATGVATWTLNGAPIKGSLVPPPAKQGFEQDLRTRGYTGPIIHQE
jgi:hypothetical protein